MASVVVNGDTSGSVTLSAPAVAGTVTVTLPATSGTMLTTASSTGVSGSAISSGTVAEAYGGTGTNTGYYGFKNRILNGQMVIDQRNAGASVTIPANAYTYDIDRWFGVGNQASKFSLQQNAGAVTPPAGFNNYLGATSLSAYSVISTDYLTLGQAIEGFNFADMAWGTANAQTVTLSFWVRSSLTGTFGGVIQNSAQSRAYPFSYTISSANTWEQKTITIAGDTTGTWVGATNGIGARIFWSLGSGSVQSGTAGAWVGGAPYSVTGATSVVGTNGATLYITGVQLEKGSTATSFDYRPYGTELQLCQRYYQRQFPLRGGGAGNSGGTGVSRAKCPFITTMRASPTATVVGSIGTYDGIGSGFFGTLATVWITPDLLEFDATFSSGSTSVGRYNSMYNDVSSGTGNLSTNGVTLSAEL